MNEGSAVIWSPETRYLGNYTPNDGTVAFYTRVSTLAAPDKTLLDLGAGRAAWFEDDKCRARVAIRLQRGKFGRVVGADVDDAILGNRTVDEALLITDGHLPMDDESVDVILCDYVLEHVDDVAGFVREADRILKPGGWFCARTPHRYSYVAMISKLLPERLGDRAVSRAQPLRKEADIFPKRYHMNRLKDIRRCFPGWQDCSFVFRTDPAYYFGKRWLYAAMSLVHRLAPAPFIGNIFAFLRKPEGAPAARNHPETGGRA